MRRILFAGVCIFCLARDARADLPTIDITQAVNSIKEQLQAAKAFATQTQQYLAQLQQLSQEVQLVASLVHDPSLGTVMALAGQTGLGNSLPVNPYQMMSLVNGFGGGVNGLSGALGKLNQLAGLTNSISSANHIYSPTDGSWTSQQLIAGGAGLTQRKVARWHCWRTCRTTFRCCKPSEIGCRPQLIPRPSLMHRLRSKPRACGRRTRSAS